MRKASPLFLVGVLGMEGGEEQGGLMVDGGVGFGAAMEFEDEKEYEDEDGG